MATTTTLFSSVIGVFQSNTSNSFTRTTTLNSTGTPVNAVREPTTLDQCSPTYILAHYAATGCLNGTYYADAECQREQIIQLCDEVAPEFIAKTALFAHSTDQSERSKNLAVLLCAMLSVRDTELLKTVFPHVINDVPMLRRFVHIMRSGVVGRKSLGTVPKRLIQQWFDERSDDELFAASAEGNPSLADIFKLVHPKPTSTSRKALYGYLLDREYAMNDLHGLAQEYEVFKRSTGNPYLERTIPNVSFQLLTTLDLTVKEWTTIALNASWQTLQANLHIFARRGVFGDRAVAQQLAKRLLDESAIRKSGILPYQLLVAFQAASVLEREHSNGIQNGIQNGIPSVIQNALHDAMEIATENVPAVEGQIYVCVDVSGSMQSPISANHKSTAGGVRCIDAAALLATALLRKNSNAELVAFEQDVVRVKFNPQDSVMTNAQKLASLNGGGTNCSAALKHLNARNASGDLVVFVSDTDSWIDGNLSRQPNRAAVFLKEWKMFCERNIKAQLVCLDIQPNRMIKTAEATEHGDILNVGGFSDDVFSVVSEFAAGRMNVNQSVSQ